MGSEKAHERVLREDKSALLIGTAISREVAVAGFESILRTQHLARVACGRALASSLPPGGRAGPASASPFQGTRYAVEYIDDIFWV